MQENTKKLLSFLLAAVMLISMLPVSITAQAESAQSQPTQSQSVPDTEIPSTGNLQPETNTAPSTTSQSPDEPTVLELGVEQSAVMQVYDDACHYTFTPEKTGAYRFAVETQFEIRARLLDEDGSWLIDRYIYAPGDEVYLQLKAGVQYNLSLYQRSNSLNTCSIIIENSPLESITFQPITIMEGTNGSINYKWDSETGSTDWNSPYYCYDAWRMLYNCTNYTAKFTDGTELTGSGADLTYNGETIWFGYSAEQSYDNQWVAENTYTMTVSVMGHTVEVPVTINASPLTDISFSPITVIEGTNGHVSRNNWNPETGNYDLAYYHYYGDDLLAKSTYTARFANGETLTGSGNYLLYDNQYCDFTTSLQQSATNPLTIGNYSMHVAVMGKIVSVPVTIRKAPEISVSIEPITMIEHKDGHWNTYYPSDDQPQQYYNYNWHNKLRYTITFDGTTTITGTGTSFYYNNEWFSLGYSDDQSYERQWTVGNTYTATVSVMGTSVEVPITIAPSPLISVSVENIYLEENKGGYWYNDPPYYEYVWSDNIYCTLTFRDGSVWTGGCYNGVEYQGEYYSIYPGGDSQSPETPWLAGNTYEVNVYVGDNEYPAMVTICKGVEETGYEYLVQDGNALIYNCTMKTEILEIPETLDGYPVTVITNLGDAMLYAKELRIPDSVMTLSTSALCAGVTYGQLNLPLEKVYIGRGLGELDGHVFKYATKLGHIDVSPENPRLQSIDGVVYNEEVTTLLAYPNAKETLHVIPDSVTDIGIFFEHRDTYAQQFANPNIRFGAGITEYKMVDGVIYNPDMTKVLLTTADATGHYEMPQSVTDIGSYPFVGSDLTSVVISSNVTGIAYWMFEGHFNLEEITIPDSVRYLDMGDTPNLQKVHISNLTHWCSGISFGYMYGNPLAIAHNLYLNGEKIVDLKIPDVVTKIYTDAFVGGSFESVTVPSSVVDIGEYAFANCTNLKAVYIFDLGAWSGTLFSDKYSNPLYYAHDLYLNGARIKDLVLTETVADRIYGTNTTRIVYGVNRYAFYNASIESVTFPEKIQSIGAEAFAGCKNLTKVNISNLDSWCKICFADEQSNPLTNARDLYLNGSKIVNLEIPSTASMVYRYAFYNGSMTSVSIPASVETIESWAFACSAVQQVGFEEGIIRIKEKAFAESALQLLALPDSLQYIYDAAFEDCTDLTTLDLANGLTSIYGYAFANTGLKTVVLPDGLVYLGEGAFANCELLESVDLGSGITNIPQEAFYRTGLKTVTLPKQVTIVGDSAFANSQITELNIECDEVTFGDSVFADCPLDDLEFGENVKGFGETAFMGTNATKAIIPTTVTYLSYRVFAFNQNLVSVTIPDSVEWIEESAFEGDENLTHVLYTGTQEQWENLDVLSNELNSAVIHFEAIGDEVTTTQTCTTVTYYCSICDREETLRKGKTTHNFVDGVCADCGYHNDWEYTINEDGKSATITKYVGKDPEVNIPAQIDGLPITAITKSAFHRNRQITSVALPAGIKSIPEEAFLGCESLQTVTAGQGLTSVGNSAFYDCRNLQSVYLPNSVKTIGDYAFYYCMQLSNFKLPKSLTSVGEYAFYCCSLTAVEIPKGLTKISPFAFSNNYSLQELTVPGTVTEICYGAFLRCTSLDGLHIDNGVQKIGDYAFAYNYYNSGFELVIPDSVAEIGDYAFCNSYLEQINIGNGVKKIGVEAFANNSKLETILFHGDCPDMNNSFGDATATAFYPAGNKTWEGVEEGRVNWYASAAPTVLKQPTNAVVDAGETITLTTAGYGHRMRYQWYVAERGSNKFSPVGGDSCELTMQITKENSGSKAYCLITDVLGQSTKTKTVTVKITPNPTGIRVAQKPYTVEYDLRQALRTRGLEIVLDYNDDSFEPVLDYVISGYDPNVGGQQTITVTYGHYTTTFTVTVNEEKLNFANQEAQIEISAPQSAVDSNASLVVEKIETKPDLPQTPEIFEENESVIFDISLEANGETVQPNETVQVSIPVPQHMQSKRCKVYHIGDDGEITDMGAHYKDGRMVFDTNHFSYYAVVETSGVTVSGTVGGNVDTEGAIVKLISGGEVIESVETQNGTYCFENVVDNDYVIEVVKANLPARQYNISVEDQNLIQDVLLAMLGDIDGNDDVNTDDVIKLLLHVSASDLVAIDSFGDFTGDGVVNTDDVVRLLLHVSSPDLFPLHLQE